jgi:uncharacterized heparinase superfamily protein
MTFAWRLHGLRYRLGRLTLRRLAYALRRPWYASALYSLTLKGRRPDKLEFVPPDAWPGDAVHGGAIIEGDFLFAGRLVHDPETPWSPDGVSERWLTECHGFGWLRNLRAVGGEAARSAARALVQDWIAAQGRWQRLAWRPDVLARRLVNWLAQAELLCTGADDDFLAGFHDSLCRQARHLTRSAGSAAPGADRITVLRGLIFAGLALPGYNRRLLRWLKQLEHEIQQQILGDGGHVERSPSVQLAVLRQLIDIRDALRAAQAEVPPALQTAIDRMAPMLRFFRHGDGGLALFNDSGEEEGWLIDVVLTRAEARGKPLESAPHTGFERLTANRTLILMDTGTAPSPGFDGHAHAGTLSFEMSIGKERLVVNCGAYADDNPGWHTAQRTTAAHSTVSVEDMNSAELLPSGCLGIRPEDVAVERREGDGNVWIDARHDGYRQTLGLVHTRRLYLAANGGDLRGEDTLDGKGSHKFAVRFHLHPSVKASLVQQGSTVLLRLASGAGWRLRASGGVTSVQEGVYLGIRGDVRRTEQVVISAATQNGHGQVKWAFSRLATNP